MENGGTKIVIGNGFDLQLGLHSRYSDFFNSETYPQKEVSELVCKSLQAIKERKKMEEIDRKPFFAKGYAWDLLFFLSSIEDCEVEKVGEEAESLLADSKKGCKIGRAHV